MRGVKGALFMDNPLDNEFRAMVLESFAEV